MIQPNERSIKYTQCRFNTDNSLQFAHLMPLFFLQRCVVVPLNFLLPWALQKSHLPLIIPTISRRLSSLHTVLIFRGLTCWPWDWVLLKFMNLHPLWHSEIRTHLVLSLLPLSLNQLVYELKKSHLIMSDFISIFVLLFTVLS